MSDYKERVNSLREHADLIEKSGAEVYGPSATRLLVYDLRNAAAAIEELLSFAHYVADKVTRSDEDWEDYHEAFVEVACRKLVKLGIVSVEDDKYVYSVEVQE